MKVYLDDERTTPDGWVRTYNVRETLELLLTGNVKELSLDHDLGDVGDVGTGYDVLVWLEEMVAVHGFNAPECIKVHSSNSSARIKMELAIKSIERFRIL